VLAVTVKSVDLSNAAEVPLELPIQGPYEGQRESSRPNGLESPMEVVGLACAWAGDYQPLSCL
jgi:hypothetical protein